MNVFDINDILITDEDIRWVKSLIPDLEFDDERITALKSLESIDINACPGSGKTTLLVAKLAILAKKWTYQNKGICVLSHTNVAREEIQTRLGKYDIGKKLLSYPHFIGTFQSYFDNFFAMPFIKGYKIPINIINDSFVLNKRYNKMLNNTYFVNQHYDMFTLDPIELLHKYPVKCKETSDTYKQIKNVVTQSRKNGEFTFNEMRLYAEKCIKERPNICKIATTRFPILFVDESQDTDDFIWEMISTIYHNGSNTIWQSFGDINQSIFDGFSQNKNTRFPRPNVISITNSKRLDNSVAQLANTVAYNCQLMKGQSYFDRNNNTIILFDSTNINQVIKKYADIVWDTFSDEEIENNTAYGIHAVGLIHNLKDDDDKYAKRLSDYYDAYTPNSFKKSPETLIDYFLAGQYLFNNTGEYSYKVNNYADGILMLLRKYSVTPPNLNMTKLRGLLKHLNCVDEKTFRGCFYELINLDISNEEQWNELLYKIFSLLDGIVKRTDIDNPDFLRWKSYPACINNENNSENTITYKKDGRISLPVHISSIHSVKGRTHLSTLVLDTKYKVKHNISSLIDYMCGKNTISPTATDEWRIRCQYVAMTRAMGLLCMALPKTNISEKQKDALLSIGWKIIEL